MTLALIEQGNQFLDNMRAARDRTVVAKADILNLRARVPGLRIFVFEGDDDKIVYHSWISRSVPGLVYEPFCCKGKDKVLALRDSLASDRADTIDGIYFFVDRDFDDLKGRDLGDRTFLTPYYALENYLVRDEVLDLVLTNEFHLNGDPDRRKIIRDIYDGLLTDFIDIATLANERIYIARRAKIEFVKTLPADCKKIAKVHLEAVEASDVDPDSWLAYKQPVPEQDIARYIGEFRELEPRCRHRGKFLLDFFKRWLDRLADDYRADQPKLFDRQEERKVRSAEFTLGSFSIKSPLPDGLRDFLISSQVPHQV